MATATELIREPEIVSTRDEEDRRHHDIQFVGGGREPIEDTAWEPITPVSRTVLEDRWSGLMLKKHNPTKLQDRLDGALWDVAEGIIRRDLGDDFAVVDGEIKSLDEVMAISELEDVIKDWFIERGAKVARP